MKNTFDTNSLQSIFYIPLIGIHFFFLNSIKSLVSTIKHVLGLFREKKTGNYRKKDYI